MTDKSRKRERVVHTLNLCFKFVLQIYLCGSFERNFLVFLNVKSQWPPIYFECEPDYNGGENYANQTGLKNQCI